MHHTQLVLQNVGCQMFGAPVVWVQKAVDSVYVGLLLWQYMTQLCHERSTPRPAYSGDQYAVTQNLVQLGKFNPPQIRPVEHIRSDAMDWIFHGSSMFHQMGNYPLKWNSGLNLANVTYQWWDEVNAGHVVHVVHLHLTVDSFISTWFNTWLENVCIVEMLHCLSAKVDAQMFQLTWLQHEDKAWYNDRWSILPAKQHLSYVLDVKRNEC